MALEIRLLDSFAVLVDGTLVDESRWPRQKGKALIKMLALAKHHRLHQDQVMDALWPGTPRHTAANNLNKVVHIARRARPDARSNGSRPASRPPGRKRRPRAVAIVARGAKR